MDSQKRWNRWFCFFLLFSILNAPLLAMSLDEKIGQLFVAPIQPHASPQDIDAVIDLIKHRHVGSVIFMASTSSLQKAQVKQLQDASPAPLLTFQDCEWGVGMRLRDVPSLPKNLTLGAIADLTFLRAFGHEVARQCKEVGIAGCLAPAVDVNSNPKNPVIGRRALGDDPHQVAERAVAIMEGLQAGGVLACAKHFPGHGDTQTDSHVALPLIDKSLTELQAIELVPFQAMIDRGVDMVMVGHLFLPQLSQQPSSLSFEIMTKLLRQQMGFQGVIITDALNMAALDGLHSSLDETLVQAFEAGADLLLTASSKAIVCRLLIEKVIPQAIEQIKEKCLKGEIDEQEIDRCVARIGALKKRGAHSCPQRPLLKQELFDQAVTLLGEGFVPLQEGRSLALVQSSDDPILEEGLSRYGDVTSFSYEQIEEALGYPSLVVRVQKGDPVDRIPSHAIVLLFDTPYLLASLPHPGPIIVGYENEREARQAVVQVLFGKLPPLGKLPLHLLTQLAP